MLGVLRSDNGMARDRLGRYFGTKVVFASITVDPERDTPEVLKQYARTFGADLNGWTSLTGAPETLGDVARRYGVFAAKTARGDVDHTFLTSIIDQSGFVRVQYLGVRFNPDEFQRDLLALLKGQ
jgi:protein SCO1